MSAGKGILFCRSSGGVVIAANKVKGIRAVAAWDEKSAMHAREHNDANIIAIAGDWTDEESAKKIVKIFLETEFTKEDRHVRRINQIMDYEMQMDWMGGCCGGGCCHEEK
jgi:ribose 5-phosphate isomerase B